MVNHVGDIGPTMLEKESSMRGVYDLKRSRGTSLDSVCFEAACFEDLISFRLGYGPRV